MAATIVFQGSSSLTLDGKGRIAVPARHRELLAALDVRAQLTITKQPGGSLMVFPRPTWEVFRERIAALPQEAAGWRRVYLGNAMDVEIDSSSRVLIAPELRRYAGLTRDVMLLGMGSYLELWDEKTYQEHEAAVLQSEMPESLKSFSF